MLKFKIIPSLGGSPGNFEPNVPTQSTDLLKGRMKKTMIFVNISNRHPQSRTQ